MNIEGEGMQKIVSAGQARSQLGRIMNDVSKKGDNVIVERSGKPLVVMIPLQTYEALRNQEIFFWDQVDAIRTKAAGFSQEEIDELGAKSHFAPSSLKVDG
jgi:prevent-host-death family protein